MRRSPESSLLQKRSVERDQSGRGFLEGSSQELLGTMNWAKLELTGGEVDPTTREIQHPEHTHTQDKLRH